MMILLSKRKNDQLIITTSPNLWGLPYFYLAQFKKLIYRAIQVSEAKILDRYIILWKSVKKVC